MAITNIKNLGKFPIDDDNMLVVDLDNISGRIKVSVRIWYRTPDGWFPGKQGLTVAPAVWQAMLKGTEAIPAEHLKAAAKPTTNPNGSGRKF